MTERNLDTKLTPTDGKPNLSKRLAFSANSSSPNSNPSRWRALGLAIAAHGLLFFVLFFGLAWKSTDDCKNGIPTKPGYFEEMWNSVRVVFGYPKPAQKVCISYFDFVPLPGKVVDTHRPVTSRPPEPAPPTEPTLTPKPVTPLTPTTGRVPDEITPQSRPDLFIGQERESREKLQREKLEREAINREKALRAQAEKEAAARAQKERQDRDRSQKEKDREKAEQEKAAREKVEREKAEREKTERAKADKEKADRDRAQKEKLEREKAEREKAEREKAERERLERERLERDKADREKVERERADRERIERERIEREKERTERQRAEREAAEQRRQRDFARDIARSQAEAGEGARPSAGGSSSVASGGGGSSNRNAEWAGRVKSAIRENTTFVAPPDMVGNPQVVFRVTLSPDCALIRVDRINSSGVLSWDQAAERAVRKTNPFPRFPGGQCPPSFELTSRPND